MRQLDSLTGSIRSLLRRISESLKQEEAGGSAEMDVMKERLALANALGRVVLSSYTLEELCDGFANELRQFMAVDWAALALINQSDGTVSLHPLSSKIPCRLNLGQVFPLSGTPVQWLAHNQSAMSEPDLSAQSRFSMGHSLIKEKVLSVVYMPLFSRRQVFGALITGSQRPHSYGDRELKLLKHAATQLATSIENNRLLSIKNEQNQKQADFIYALAHELKTPLTPIRASSELLAEELGDGVDSVQAKLAQNIRQSARILDEKLTAMLELAKVESPHFRSEVRSVDLNALLEVVLLDVSGVLQVREQVLNSDVPDLPPVTANEVQLRRVLQNVLANASRLSPVGGIIHITAGQQENRVLVEVRNTGEGFSESDLAHLFEAYNLETVDRERLPQVKLDLALNKRLIELQGGSMWVTSKPGEGSVFTLALPLYQKESEQAPEATQVKRVGSDQSSKRKHRRLRVSTNEGRLSRSQRSPSDSAP